MKYLAILLLFLSSSSYAGWCGGGKITNISEGAWNLNDFFIRIDYSVMENGHEGTNWADHWIRFQSNINTDRLNGIRSMAVAAYLSNSTVYVWSHNNRCDAADELRLGNDPG